MFFFLNLYNPTVCFFFKVESYRIILKFIKKHGGSKIAKLPEDENSIGKFG